MARVEPTPRHDYALRGEHVAAIHYDADLLITIYLLIKTVV
jgi:hypothetical protein